MNRPGCKAEKRVRSTRVSVCLFGLPELQLLPLSSSVRPFAFHPCLALTRRQARESDMTACPRPPETGVFLRPTPDLTIHGRHSLYHNSLRFRHFAVLDPR